MAVPYPSNPAVGDSFTYLGVLYTWNGVAWISEFTNTPGAVGSVAVTAPITNSGTPTAPVIGINQGALTIAQSQVTDLVSDLATITSDVSGKANLAGGNALTGTQTVTITGSAGTNVLGLKSNTDGAGNLLNVRFESANGNLFDLGKNETSNQSGSFYLYTGSALPIEFYNGGTKRLIVESNGNINIGGATGAGSSLAKLSLFNTASATIAQVVRGAASQSANLQEWQSSAGTVLARIASTGQLLAPSIVGTAFQITSGGIFSNGSTSAPANVQAYFLSTAATNAGLVVRGASSQSADLLELQNNSGTDLLSVNASGGLLIGTTHLAGATPGLGQMRTSTNTGLNYVDTTANDSAGTGPGYTARRSRGTLAAPTQVQSGDLLFGIFAQGWHDAAGFGGNSAAIRMLANQNFTTTALGSSMVFETASDGTTGRLERMRVTGSGTVSIGTTSSLAQLGVVSASASTKGQVIRGAASQSGNYLEIQNSAGSVQMYVDANLNIRAIGAIALGNLALGAGLISGQTTSASQIGAVIRGATSQTADLQQWQNSAGVANLKINSIGDINGTIVNGSYPITYNIMTGHNPEGKLTANPMLVNDIAYARLRGSTFTWTGLTPSSSDIDAMFNASSSFWNVAAGSFPNPQVIEFTSPVTLTYGAFFGISFGNSGWAVRDITLEAFSEGVWKTVATTTSNNSEVFMGAIPTNAGVGTTKFRITLATPLGAAVRITHIFAYNFASPLAKQIYLGRDGGTMFGDVYGSGKTMGFGFGRFGSDINWTDSTALKATAVSAGDRALIVKGVASQTANLTEWQNSAGSILARVAGDGQFVSGQQFTAQGGLDVTGGGNGLRSIAGAATVIPLLVRGASAQTADLLVVQNNSLTTQFRVDPNGMTIANSLGVAGSPSGISYAYFTTPSASAKPVVVRGAASQTANLQEWQNSAGTVLARVESSGNFIIAGIGVTSGDHRVGTSSYFSAALNVLARATTEKGLVVRGQPSQTANHFETQDTSGTTRFYIDAAHNANFSSASWVQNSTGKLTLGLTSASAVGLTVRGTGTGGVYTQTANLQEWLSWDGSTPTTLSYIKPDGSLYINTNANATGIYFKGTSSDQSIRANGNDLFITPRFDLIFQPTDTTGRLRPANDNQADLGTSGQRWKNIYGVGATLNGLTLSGTTSTITLNGSVGTSGQVLTSAGAGATPTWTTVSGGTFTGGTLTSNLTLAAGTTSLSPLTFQSGTNLTTVTAGANEYDGTVFYQTSNITPGRALKTQNYYYISSSDFAIDFSESGAVQSMIGGPTTGITVAAGTTYEYEIELAVQHQFLVNSGITGTFQIVNSTVSGSPTVAVTSYVDYGSNTTSFVTATTMSSVRTTGSVTFIPTISSGSRYAILRAKGVIRVTGTGTTKIYPGLSASGTNDNAWTVASGLIFNLTPIGNGTVTTVGTWA
jgi:hypothetical protein